MRHGSQSLGVEKCLPSRALYTQEKIAYWRSATEILAGFVARTCNADYAEYDVCRARNVHVLIAKIATWFFFKLSAISSQLSADSYFGLWFTGSTREFDSYDDALRNWQ
jgi:hypothetical protein